MNASPIQNPAAGAPSPRGSKSFARKLIGRTLISVVGLISLIALFYAEENWRGKRAWNRYERQLASAGVELDFQKLVPPRVPDEQNFAMTPFLAPLFEFNPRPLKPGQSIWRDVDGYYRVTNFATAFTPPAELPNNQDRIQLPGRLTDLDHWLLILREQTHSAAAIASFSNRAETAAALLKELEIYNPVLDELVAASHRPSARFNIQYDSKDPASMLVAHLPLFRRIARLLNVRASAELAGGQSAAAADDARFLFYLAESIHDEPIFVSQAVRMEILATVEQVIWEGLTEHRWTDVQLNEFELQLRKIAVLADVKKAIEGERAAFGKVEFDFIRSHPNVLQEWLREDDNNFWAYSLLWVPRGWLYLEQIACQRAYDDIWFPAIDSKAGRINTRSIDQNSESTNQPLNSSLSDVIHHRLFLRLFFPSLRNLFLRAGLAQTGVDEAGIACAVERYHLAKGRFPDSLDALVPRYLERIPTEVCSGQPLRYRLRDDGRFLLYSAGWNEKDDGGVVARQSNGTLQDQSRGDWVWPEYPNRP